MSWVARGATIPGSNEVGFGRLERVGWVLSICLFIAEGAVEGQMNSSSGDTSKIGNVSFFKLTDDTVSMFVRTKDILLLIFSFF